MDRKRKARLFGFASAAPHEPHEEGHAEAGTATPTSTAAPPPRKGLSATLALLMFSLLLLAVVVVIRVQHSLHPEAIPSVQSAKDVTISSALIDRARLNRSRAFPPRQKRKAAPPGSVLPAKMRANGTQAAQPARTHSDKPVVASTLVPVAKTPLAQVNTPKTCGKLSKELLQQWAVNNTVMITFTDYGMMKMYGDTWLYNVKKAGIRYWVLAAQDQRAADLIIKKGAHQCFMGEQIEVDNLHAEFQWGSKTWQLHTWQKVVTVRHVHEFGFHVVHSDMDVIWFRDPMPYFLQRFTWPDYMPSLDPSISNNPPGDDGPEKGVTAHHYMNTGVYFLRNTPGGSRLIDTWYSIRKKQQRQGFHDQDGLYKYLTESDMRERVDAEKRVTWVINQTVALAQLPPNSFQNGYSHCINQIHKAHGTQPYETHFVWVYGFNWGKMHRMREFKYFHDPPEYYSQGRFLSVGLTAFTSPPGFNEWKDTEAMVATHLQAMQQQLRDVYWALAVAHALDRILILPKLMCHCIHNWFESPLCRLPGELITHLPFVCPADYVFNMDKLYSVVVRGRPLAIREHSFMENPRMPREVQASFQVVELANPNGTAPNANAIAPAANTNTSATPPVAPADPDVKDPRAKLTKQAKDEKELAELLSPYKGAKVLHLVAAVGAFERWSDEGLKREFQEAMDRLPVKWCCRTDQLIKEGKPRDFQYTIRP